MERSQEIARCEREFAACLAYDGPQWLGALMGAGDWYVEAHLMGVDLLKREQQRARRREYLLETGRDLQAFNEGLIDGRRT